MSLRDYIGEHCIRHEWRKSKFGGGAAVGTCMFGFFLIAIFGGPTGQGRTPASHFPPRPLTISLASFFYQQTLLFVARVSAAMKKKANTVARLRVASRLWCM